jgi:hypothetical protein
VALPTAPTTDWLQANNINARSTSLPWYYYRPTVRGTVGAPMTNSNFDVWAYPSDGVQGVITNNSGQRLVVRTTFRTRDDRGRGITECCSEAILDPGDQMSYQLDLSGTLEFYRYDNGQAVGSPIKLFIKDNYAFRPETEFTPPGRNEPVTKRDGWKEGQSHEEIWGDTKLWVKREVDGWKVSASDLYDKYYRDPDMPSDWAIFTIRVDGIAG